MLSRVFKTKDCDEYQSFWLILRPVLKITTSSPINLEYYPFYSVLR